MKKLLLSISIAALAFTSMQDISAGIITKIKSKVTGKSVEEIETANKEKADAKAAKKSREADIKAMKTCAADLTQQTLKLMKAFITCVDKLKDTATMKDAAPNTAESVNKVLLIRDAANDFLRILLYCHAGCVNIENALKEKEGSETQKSYFKQAIDAREIISNIRANLGIDMVSLVELIKDNEFEIFNAKKIKEIIKKLDGELRGTGKKNDVGLSTSWESALKKFEDQAVVYYNLNKDEALDMADDEVKEYPLFDFITTGNHLENIRQILSNIFPAFIAFVNDICDGKSNNGSSYIQSVRQALKIKGLQVSSELEFDESEAKVKKSRRQGTNKKTKAKAKEAEDSNDEELNEEDEEFFNSARKKSAEKRGSEAEKKSNKSKMTKMEDDEELEDIKASSKKKSHEAEDVTVKKGTSSKKKQKLSDIEDEESPVPPNDEDE